jgi:hypothetical protein
MAALVVVLCLMAYFGYRAATQPVPDAGGTPTQQCTKSEISKQTYIRPSDLTVSVYNAGADSGAAGRTMQRLEDRGFHAGDVSNAPAGSHVRVARVYTTRANDTGAKLVARTLGKGVKVVVTDKAMGPGIDVYVGPKLGHLAKDAPRRLKLPKPIVTCVPVE